MKQITKAVNQIGVSEEVQKMLKHFKTSSFLNIYQGGVSLGLHGSNVKQNIQNEWWISNFVSCDEPTFHASSDSKIDVTPTFSEIKSLIKELPFNIICKNKVQSTKTHSSELQTDGADIIGSKFKDDDVHILKRYMFCSPQQSVNLFQKLQRERKLWWKKFSALPGRFEVSGIHNNNDNSQYVEIKADFPWGTFPVETIKHETKGISKEVFRMEETGQEITPHVITCETVLEKVVLTFLCDSYGGLDDQEDSNTLRLHKKLAPYKIAFSGTASSPEIEYELRELATLLAKQIRKTSNSALLLPDMCTLGVNSQLRRNDALGIPYTIIMNDTTLKDGMLGIRSRDTTLKEESHVSLLVTYVEKLMKNY